MTSEGKAVTAFRWFVVALCFQYSAPSVALEAAGRVIYAFGDVSAVDAQGGERRLERNAAVYGGETVRTRAGRAHVKFNDDGFAALNPNTSYRIDDFIYQGQPDGSERGFFSLIRGSVRIVTGIIGHRNKANFKLQTPTATIGIRGTSGLIQHCAGDCAGKEDGTYVAGYGGTWELKSGLFEGTVDSGEAYHCTGAGAGCTQLEAAPEQREDVAIALATEELDEPPVESPAAAGIQVGANGKLCDFGGGCGGALVTDVLLSNIGPDQSGSGVDGGTEQGVLISDGTTPVAFVSINRVLLPGLGFEDLDIDTVDVAALEAALPNLPGPLLRERTEHTLALAKVLDPSLFETLAASPATVATDDFGQTSDGLLTKGRYTDGFILRIENFVFLDPVTGDRNEDDSIFTRLVGHSGFQSTHFIFGSDPGLMEFLGQGVYSFTGGTLSTSASGSMIGSGVTSGSLGWIFGLDIGQLDMNVLHGGTNFRVLANLVADPTDRRIFADFFAAAFTGSTSFQTGIEGFFAAGTSGGAPRAAGLHYVIETPDPIIGAAGFGLTSATAFASPAAPAGTVVAWSNSYIDSANFFGFGPGVLVGAPDAMIVDQVNNRAVLGSESVFASTSSFNGPCSLTACTFNGTTGTQVESGSAPALGVSWARFAGGYLAFNPANVDPNGSVTNRGEFHLIASTAPATSLPTSGQIVYSTIVGGTAPTLNAGPTGEVTQAGALSSVSVTVDYGLGDITNAQVVGSFANASFALGSSGPTPISSPVMLGSGLVFTNSGTCVSGCAASSVFDLSIVGAGGAGVMGSYGAGTGVVAPGEQFSVNGTFVVTP